MRVLVHVCCGPCSPHVLRRLRDEGHQVSTLFYNPNIHPYTEYQARMEAAEKYCAGEGVEFILRDEYDVFRFTAEALEWMARGKDRCEYCYGLRLDGAAREAAERGFDAFTSTLLASPYQKHELARQLGDVAADEHGVEFRYMDFRDGWKESRKATFDCGLYRQKYCGCIYSEQERWLGERSDAGSP
jgi:predicted adenine nucleotide alpha hydrolase (AANH) superfamily ATPase